MNYQARIEIREFAESLLQKILQNKLSFPVDMEEIIEYLGGTIHIGFNEPAADAKIERTDGDSFTIHIKDYLSEVRKRFTLAHELGHLFLQMHFLDAERWANNLLYEDGAFRRTTGDYRQEELQANEFAASFLMPHKEFSMISRDNLQNNSYNIRGIAEYFGVSVDAASIHGKWLGLFRWEK